MGSPVVIKLFRHFLNVRSGPRVRETEATAAAQVLGIPVSRLRFARFPDGGIQPTGLDQVAAVVWLLREVRPDLVYLPHADDASFDHRAGFELAWHPLPVGTVKRSPCCD